MKYADYVQALTNRAIHSAKEVTTEQLARQVRSAIEEAIRDCRDNLVDDIKLADPESLHWRHPQ